MTLILSGTDGLSDVDGSAATPAIRGTDTNTGIFFPAADTIAFSEGGTEAMRIDSSGNVGVGTSSPTARLHVSAPDGTAPLTLNTAGGSDSTRALNFNVAGDNYGKILVPSGSGGAMAFWTGGANAAAERVRIDSSGNVGIGTTSPTTKAQVSTATGGSTSGLSVVASGNMLNIFGSSSTNAGVILDATNGTVGSATAVPTIFRYGGTESMRIDTSGNTYFGSNQNYSTGAVTRIYGSSVSGYARMDFNKYDSGTFGTVQFYHRNGNVGAINVSDTATAYATSSDYRLKHDITPMTGALAKVAALKPVTYKWNADDSDGEGFIAHELQAVVPQCVTGEKDAVETYTDEEGNEQTRPKYQGIDTSFLVATLTAAIQELKAINDAQAQTIQSLTARIEALEGK